jgi:hypothetical protein
MYYGQADEDSSSVILLLEDFGHSRQGDVLLGCSIDEGLSVVDRILPLHAMWWGKTDDPILDAIPNRLQDPDEFTARYRENIEPFLDIYGTRLPAALVAYLRVLGISLQAKLLELAAAPWTIIHGDLHLDNVLFNQDQAVVIDWQSVSKGPAMLDIAAFVCASLSPGDFDRGLSRLVRHYPDGLALCGVRGLDLDAMNRQLAHALIRFWCSGLGWMINANRTQPGGREQDLVNSIIDNGRLVNAMMKLAVEPNL